MEGRSSRLLSVAAAALVAGVAAIGTPSESPARQSPSALPAVRCAADAVSPGRAGLDVHPRLEDRIMRQADWWGGVYRTDAGEAIRVYVSDCYPADESRARGWVDFLGSLVHGRELADLTLYVAPAGVVTRMCGDDALGCYFADDESIVLIGDEVELPDPLTVEQVLAHEYGHHVANHRSNSPWRAVAWGTKRWASFMEVCARVREGSAGDRYDRYPAEAFAESYRVLSDRARGVPFDWPLVDPSFAPRAKALELVRLDVLVPWRATTVRLRTRLAAGRVARFVVATPNDGTLTVRVAAARGLRVGMTLVAPHADSSLARGARRATTTICGTRRVLVEIHAVSGSGLVTLILTKP